MEVPTCLEPDPFFFRPRIVAQALGKIFLKKFSDGTWNVETTSSISYSATLHTCTQKSALLGISGFRNRGLTRVLNEGFNQSHGISVAEGGDVGLLQ